MKKFHMYGATLYKNTASTDKNCVNESKHIIIKCPSVIAILPPLLTSTGLPWPMKKTKNCLTSPNEQTAYINVKS